MRKRIKNLLERNSFLIAMSLTILIAYLSLKNLKIEIPIKITSFDKILHVIAYYTLSTSWLFHFKKNQKNKYLILIFIFLYGVLLEFMQGWFNPNRTKDFYDMIANSIGIILAYIFFKSILLGYKKIFVDYN